VDIKVTSRFGVGDTVHEVFWCTDIDAWQVDSWGVYNIVVTVTGDGRITLGYSTHGAPDVIVNESDTLFTTGTAAADEAKRRNHKLRG